MIWKSVFNVVVARLAGHSHSFSFTYRYYLFSATIYTHFTPLIHKLRCNRTHHMHTMRFKRKKQQQQQKVVHFSQKILCFEHFVTKCVWYLITSSLLLLLLCFLHATIDAHSTKSRFDTTKQSQCAMCSALFLNFSWNMKKKKHCSHIHIVNNLCFLLFSLDLSLFNGSRFIAALFACSSQLMAWNVLHFYDYNH